MTIREVLKLGNPLLRLPCAPVTDPSSPNVAQVIGDLADTLDHWRETTTYGRGIAAPQIGVMQRIIFLNLDRNSPWPLINPEIISHSDAQMVVWDACLSFLSIFCQVTRHAEVTVRYQHPDGRFDEIHAQGDLAELLQHEIDHLDGILAVDRIVDIKTLCTREEFEKRHRDATPYSVS